MTYLTYAPPFGFKCMKLFSSIPDLINNYKTDWLIKILFFNSNISKLITHNENKLYQ